MSFLLLWLPKTAPSIATSTPFLLLVLTELLQTAVPVADSLPTLKPFMFMERKVCCRLGWTDLTSAKKILKSLNFFLLLKKTDRKIWNAMWLSKTFRHLKYTHHMTTTLWLHINFKKGKTPRWKNNHKNYFLNKYQAQGEQNAVNLFQVFTGQQEWRKAFVNSWSFCLL